MGHFVKRADPSPVTANRVSFISGPTTRSERSDPDELVRTVGRKTSRLLENGMAWPVMATRVCLATAIRDGRLQVTLAYRTAQFSEG